MGLKEVIGHGTMTKPDGTVVDLGPGCKFTYEEAMPRDTLTIFEPGQDPRMDIALEIAKHLMSGKGEERHGRGADFKDQPWVYLSRTYPGFLQGQAAKKIDESMGMDDERAARELVSAAGYLILAVLKLRGGVR